MGKARGGGSRPTEDDATGGEGRRRVRIRLDSKKRGQGHPKKGSRGDANRGSTVQHPEESQFTPSGGGKSRSSRLPKHRERNANFRRRGKIQ